MHEAVLLLYGIHNPLHPWREDMFDRPDKLKKKLKNRNLGGLSLDLDIGVVLSKPTGKDEIPKKVRIARSPTYDQDGDLDDAHFQEDKGLAKYPCIVDHNVPNFRRKTINKEGIAEEHASGIGIEPRKLVNHKRVQEYGNDKDKAEKDVLEHCGVALESFGVYELSLLKKKWGEGKVIFKPRSGALSSGIVVFDSLEDLGEAVDQDKVASNGLVQPFINLREPILHLAPLTAEYEDQLLEVNSIPDRVREIRMHFFVTTVNGKRNVEAYPMLRTSEIDAQIMKNWDYTPLDPEAFYKHHLAIYEKTIQVADRLTEKSDVPHLYGVTDWAMGPHPIRPEEQILFVGDLNCRGPRLPDVSRPGYTIDTPAQKEFILMLKTMAGQVLNEA